MGRSRTLALVAVTEHDLEGLLANPLNGLDHGGTGCCKPPGARARRQVLQRCQGRVPLLPIILQWTFLVLRRLKWISFILKLALAENGWNLRFPWCFRGEKPAWQSVATVNEPLFSL